MSACRGELRDITVLCAWPECTRAPKFRIQYDRGEAPALRLSWLPKGKRGLVNLCDRHASEFGATLGSEQIRTVRLLK